MGKQGVAYSLRTPPTWLIGKNRSISTKAQEGALFYLCRVGGWENEIFLHSLSQFGWSFSRNNMYCAASNPPIKFSNRVCTYNLFSDKFVINKLIFQHFPHPLIVDRARQYFKGTVAWDFWTPFFCMNHSTHPRLTPHWTQFRGVIHNFFFLV